MGESTKHPILKDTFEEEIVDLAGPNIFSNGILLEIFWKEFENRLEVFGRGGVD